MSKDIIDELIEEYKEANVVVQDAANDKRQPRITQEYADSFIAANNEKIDRLIERQKR